MVRAHLVFAEPLAELMGNPFHQPASVDKHEGGSMGLYLRHELVVNLAPDVVSDDGAQLLLRKLDPEVQIPLMARIDDFTVGLAIRQNAFRPDQQPGYIFDGLLGCAETDALERSLRELLQAFEGQRQMRSPLILGYGVNFIDNNGLGVFQESPTSFGRQQDIERLRRGDENMRRVADHRLPLMGRGIPGTHGDSDAGQENSLRVGQPIDLCQRRLKIFRNVIAQRLQGGDIDDLRRFIELPAQRPLNQAVDGPKKCG